MKTQLIIPDIEGDVHLGCLPEERLQTQKVRISIEINFSEPPTTCNNDHVAETPCYAQMSDILSTTFKEKHYNTIEHLGMASYHQIQNYLENFESPSLLKLKVNKLHPPVDSIKTGCLFVLEGQL